jgi:hypothetical protein
MNTKGITLQLGDDLYTLEMPDTLANQITRGDEKRLRQPVNLFGMSITDDGCRFVTTNDAGEPAHELKYAPERFDDFIQSMDAAGAQRTAILKLGTSGARQMLRTFYSWLNHKQAEEFERGISAGELTFDEARTIRKEAFDVPQFAQFFAQSFKSGNMPTAKKGKRRTYSRSVEELYALACRIYRETPGLSFESACSAATEQRADLVPSGWVLDPDGNLKREAARYWDKSQYSQKSYRERRDR